jgi:signal peptidase I
VRTFGFGLYQVPTGSMETTMLVGERFFADKFTYLFYRPERSDIIAFNDPTFNYSDNALVRLYQEYVGWPIWPMGPSNWTKRVIGIPGDHVKGVVEDGKPVVYLNDKKLDESYLNKYPLLALVRLSTGDEDWRSYDPNKSDKEQPFYRINVEDPYYPRFDIGVSREVTLTKDGRLLKEPGKPNVVYPGRVRRVGGKAWNGSDEFDVTLGENQYWLMGDNRRGSADSRFLGPIDGRLIHGKIKYRIWSIDSNESWWILDLIKHPIDFWSRMRWDRFFQRVV